MDPTFVKGYFGDGRRFEDCVHISGLFLRKVPLAMMESALPVPINLSASLGHCFARILRELVLPLGHPYFSPKLCQVVTPYSLARFTLHDRLRSF